MKTTFETGWDDNWSNFYDVREGIDYTKVRICENIAYFIYPAVPDEGPNRLRLGKIMKNSGHGIIWTPVREILPEERDSFHCKDFQ